MIEKDNDAVPRGPQYVPDKWCVSPYNYVEEVRAGYRNMPKKVLIRDVTLAEGQHQPGVHYVLDEKLRIAHALREAGITMIKQHVGDFETFEFLKVLKGEIPDMYINVVFPVYDYSQYRDSLDKCKEDMDILAGYKVDEVTFPGHNSWNVPENLAKVMSKEARMARYEELTRYARSKGIGVEVGQVDVLRTPWEDLKELWTHAINAGATSIACYDSYGVSTPDGMRYLVEKTLKEFHVPVLVHVHNDLCSAEASTIGGILGGGTLCDLSVNGLGDRSGNASMEAVVLQLEMNYAIDTGVKLDKLLGLCRMVEKATGVAYVKPISGRYAFTHESEAHASMVLSQGLDLTFASKHEAYAPSVVGGKREVRFGGTSLTGTMIKLRLEQLGLKVAEREVQEISDRIKNTFTSRNNDLSLDEFDEIAREVYK